MTFEFEIPADLDLPLCVTCGQVFRWQETEPGAWVGVDGDAWFEVRGDGVTSNRDYNRFRSLFALDVDYNQVRADLVRCDSRLAPIIEGLPGLRLMRPSNPIETIFSFLCTANNHVPRIASMVRKLAAFGDPLGVHRPEPSRGYNAFPSLERLAGIEESELRELGFGYRAQSIPEVARRLRSTHPVEELAAKPYADLVSALIEIPSIGPKLSDCIALYAFHRTEAVPIDTHLWKAAEPLYGPFPPTLNSKSYVALGLRMRERFGNLAGYAQHYLFVERLRRLGSMRTHGQGQSV